jgi:hypothetical protein
MHALRKYAEKSQFVPHSTQEVPAAVPTQLHLHIGELTMKSFHTLSLTICYQTFVYQERFQLRACTGCLQSSWKALVPKQ